MYYGTPAEIPVVAMFFQDGNQIPSNMPLVSTTSISVVLKTITFTHKDSRLNVGTCQMVYYGETLTGKSNLLL